MHVLVVEDDPGVSGAVKRGLEEAGYTVTLATTLAEAESVLAAGRPEAVVLDRGLPDGEGLDLLARIRERHAAMPVLILTARDEIGERVAGLDAGADDYLAKPFSFSELEARLRALLRRSKASDPHRLLVEDLEVDLLSRTVRRAGGEIILSPREFDLLAYLARAAGRVVSREMLARDVWKIRSRATPADNLIDVHISHLRDKIDKGFETKLLHTVRGVGFSLGRPA